MTVAQLQLLLAGALGANVLLLLVLVLPSLLARRLPGGDDPDLLVPPDLGEIALQVAAAQGDGPADMGGVSRLTSEAAVRLVSYGFLGTAAVAVAISGAWPATAAAIYVLLGVAVLAVAVVHDLLPARILGPGKFILEGTGTVAVVTLLVALTGGAASPFVVGYFLIAAGAALLVDARTNFLLAASISILYLVTVFLVQAAQPLATMDVARLVAGLVAFWLISYLASVVARAQRTTRDAAVRLSLIDPLTRLANRAYVMAVLDREVQRARRTSRGFCVLAADLDGLKPINDTFGHPMGDRILRAVGEVIGSRIRGIDTAGRVGGDEFMILLPETEEAGAVILAEQLREGVNEIRVDAGTWVVRTSISVGVASFPADGDTAGRAPGGRRRGDVRLQAWRPGPCPPRSRRPPDAPAAPPARGRDGVRAGRRSAAGRGPGARRAGGPGAGLVGPDAARGADLTARTHPVPAVAPAARIRPAAWRLADPLAGPWPGLRWSTRRHGGGRPGLAPATVRAAGGAGRPCHAGDGPRAVSFAGRRRARANASPVRGHPSASDPPAPPSMLPPPRDQRLVPSGRRGRGSPGAPTARAASASRSRTTRRSSSAPCASS